jgi:hypothetical protein
LRFRANLLASNREPPDSLPVDKDVKLVMVFKSKDYVEPSRAASVPLQPNRNVVLGVEWKMMSNRYAATGP